MVVCIFNEITQSLLLVLANTLISQVYDDTHLESLYSSLGTPVNSTATDWTMEDNTATNLIPCVGWCFGNVYVVPSRFTLIWIRFQFLQAGITFN